MSSGVRVDRWLWAARFFKTRAQAKAAIEGGKVDYHLVSSSNDQTIRPKVSKELAVGDRLTIRRSATAETIVVTGLSEKRGNATAARELYRETDESIEARETEVARRRMERAGLKMPEHRPSKRDRRELDPFSVDGSRMGFTMGPVSMGTPLGLFFQLRGLDGVLDNYNLSCVLKAQGEEEEIDLQIQNSAEVLEGVTTVTAAIDISMLPAGQYGIDLLLEDQTSGETVSRTNQDFIVVP